MRSTTFILPTLLTSTSAFSLSTRAGTSNNNNIKTRNQAVSVPSKLDNNKNNKQNKKSISDPFGLYPQDSPERLFGLIESLESSSLQEQQGQILIDPLSLYEDKSVLTNDVVMSASLPFLKCPEFLDGSLPGDRGFDPFNFASNPQALTWYRDAEIKHARLAMLAAVGWPVAELAHKAIASQFDLNPILGVNDKVPSVLNGGLGLTNPLFWVTTISAAAALEFISIKNGDNTGAFGFDPLSFTGDNVYQDKKRTFFAEEAEIFNGRLAMLGITGFAAQEFFTNMSVINQTPIFFKPFGHVVEQLLAAGGVISV
mmetsp:Transcript_5246/g.5802  ORF Transcript_5246/g.5802 Transcript_5246/m.5802 type:complete len:313 (-) Transcript_5246:69-1007(-)